MLKTLHVTCVALTICLLVARLLLAATGRDYRRYGPLRWLPHVVDTVLLASAVALVAVSSQYPFVMPWLTAKVLALPLYIIAGVIALDSRRPRPARLAGALAAVLLVTYIVLVALTRNPWPLAGF